mgnify:CR=1 FL=1
MFPHLWELHQDGPFLEIVPCSPPRGLVLYFVALAVLTVILAIIVVIVMPLRPLNLLIAAAMTAGLVLSFVLGIVFVQAMGSSELSRGPILQISIENRLVRLPRENKSWPLDHVLKWEIVFGTELKRMVFNRHPNFPEVISELQMIVKNDDGSVEAWPIIGAQGSKDRYLLSVARAVSEMTDLPCVRTNGKITETIR